MENFTITSDSGVSVNTSTNTILQVQVKKKNKLNFTILFYLLLTFFLGGKVIAQTHFESGDTWQPATAGWNSYTAMSQPTTGKYMIDLTSSATGNKYFRTANGTGTNRYGPSGTSDVQLTVNAASTLTDWSSANGKANYITVANTGYHYIFKSNGTTSKQLAVSEVQGPLQTVSTVAQSPVVGSVSSGNTVTITATLSAAFSVGQTAYLRYSTNAFATSSTVVAMTVTADTKIYTATIPTQVAGTTVSYYVFTAGSVGLIPASDGSNADWYTFNLNNNSGANFSYRVSGTFYSKVAGDWATATNWATGSHTGTVASSYPQAGDVVYLQHAMTFAASAACATIYLDGSTATLTPITINTPNTLAVSGTIRLTSDEIAAKAYTITGTGTVTCANIECGNDLGTGTLSNTIAMSLKSSVSNLTCSGTLTVRANTYGGNKINTEFDLLSGTMNLGNLVVTTEAQNLLDAKFTNSGSATLKFTGSGSVVTKSSGQGGTTATETVDFTGSSVEYNGTSNLTIFPTSYKGLSINNTGGTAILGGDINVAGDWTNNGTFSASTYNVTFNGAANQAIGGSNTTAFNKIYLKNSGYTTTLNKSASATELNFYNLAAATGSTFSVATGVTLTVSGSVINSSSANAITNTLSGLGTVTCSTINLGSAGPLSGPGTVTNQFISTISNLTCSGNLTITALNDSNLSNHINQTFTITSGTVKVSAIALSSVTSTTATIVNNGTLQISGTGTVVSTSGAGTNTITFNGTVEYNGTSPQNVYTTTYSTLKINNSDSTTGCSLVANVSATSLNLTKGLLTTTRSSYLTIPSSGSIVNGSASSYVNGPLALGQTPNGVSIGTYPVGKGGRYLPVTLSGNGCSNGSTLLVEAFSGDCGGTASTGVCSLSKTEYWLIMSTVTASSDTKTLQFSRPEALGNLTLVASTAFGTITNVYDAITITGNYTSKGVLSSGQSWAFGSTNKYYIVAFGSSIADAGTATATASTICSGNSTTITVSGYTSGATIAWQQSTDGSSWGSVSGGSGSTAATYTTPSLSSSTYYRAAISGGPAGCSGTSYTASTFVTVSVTNTWLGGTSTDWNTAANWSCSAVPTSSSNVTIPSGTTYSPTISSASAVANSITINSGATLTMTGQTLTITSGGSFANSGTFTAGTGTVAFAGSGTITGTVVFNSISLAGAVSFSTAVTVNGTLSINAGGSVTTNAPIYGNTSTLKYNTGSNPHTRGIEWSANGVGTINSTVGYPNNVQVSGSTTFRCNTTNNVTTNAGAMAGSLTIDSGSAFYSDWGAGSCALTIAGNLTMNGNFSLGGISGGDLTLGGNWTRANSGASFNSNGRLVTFNKVGTQVVTTTGGGTESFAFVSLTNGSTLQLSSSPATNVTITSASGLTLTNPNTASSIDLNGQIMTISGGGNLDLGAGTRNITSTISGGVFLVSGSALTVTNGGTLSFAVTNTTLKLSTSFNCGANMTTVNGNLQIESGGSVNTNPPIYGASSTLIYNSGTTYGRSTEWSTTSGAGYPNNITLSNSTTLTVVNGSNSYKKAAGTLTVNGASTFSVADLTVGNGSGVGIEFLGNIINDGTISLNAGSNTTSKRLKAVNLTNGNSNSSAAFNLSGAVGGDLELTGNYTDNANFTANQRAVFFTGTGTQVVSGSATAPFNIDYIVSAKSTGTIQLGVDLLTAGPNGGNAITLTSATDILDLNGKTLTIGASGVSSGITGSGFFKGSTSSNLIINGTGAFGTIKFDQTTLGTTNALNNFTLNRTTGGVIAGNNFTVNGILNLSGANTSATVGLLDMGTNVLTMGASATTTGTGDVTGIITRNTIADKTEYTFGNQYTSLSLTKGTTLPTALSVKVVLSQPSWKNNAIKRYYSIYQTGGSSDTKVDVKLHYLVTELDSSMPVGSTSFDFFDYDGSPVVHDHGHTSDDAANKWVQLSGLSITYVAPNTNSDFSQKQYTLGLSTTPNFTWLGTVSTDWNTLDNWSGALVPTSTSDVVIPDASTTDFDPTLPSSTTIKSMSIAASGILNGGTGTSLTLTASSGSAWMIDATAAFSPGTSTVVFSGSSTIAGTTTFNSLTVGAGATVTPANGTIIKIAGNLTLNGAINLTTYHNTVEYNGNSSQSVANTTYHDLTFTGSGAKTLPTSLSLEGNWTNNSTVTAGSGTVIFSGSGSVGAQTVGGATATTFNNLTLSGSGIKTFAIATPITAALSIASGVVANLGTFIHTAGSLTLNGSTQATASSYGGTGSPAATVNSTYFADATGVVNVGTCSTYSLTSTSAVACQGVGATVTLVGNLPNGTYTVYYTLSGANTSSSSATMTVTTAGSGTFATSAITNNGATFISIDYIRSGCVSKISTNNTATIGLSVSPTTSVAGSAITQCNTSVFTLAANAPTIGTGLWSVTSGTATITDSSSPTSVVTGVVAGTSATLTWTISNGSCTASTSTVVLTNNALPTITGTAGVCLGSTTVLTGSGTAASTNAWSSSVPGVATINTTSTTGTITPVAAGTSDITYTDANGCISVATTVTVSAPSLGGLATAASDYVCSGGSTIISLTGNRGDAIQWQQSANGTSGWTPISGATTTSYTTAAISATTYYRAIVSNGTCSSATSSVASVTMPASATNSSAQTVCSGSVVLSGNIPTAGTGVWTVTSGPDLSPTQFNNTALAAATFTPSVSGTYEVTWTITYNCGSGDIASSAAATITVGGGSTTTWNGSGWSNGAPTSSSTVIIAGNYTSNGTSITACTLVINNNAVVDITSGDDVVLNGALTVAAGSSFTIENNASLVQSSNVANSGIINVKHNSSPLYRLDYTLWSSPVASQNLVLFSPLTSVSPSRFYTYNTSIDLYDPITPPSSYTFDIAKGYLIRMPNTWIASGAGSAASWTGTFKGVPNNGNITYSMSSVGKGYNAVGNPYPSAINFAKFINANKNNIEGTIYFWRKTNNSSNPISYSTCTNAGCTVNNGHTYTDFSLISVGQGFIVKAKSGQTVLNFDNAMRSPTNVPQFFRTAAVNRYWLELSNVSNVSFGKKMVTYIPEATFGYDDGLDGLFLNDTKTALLSIADTHDLVIQARPDFTADDVVPLVFITDVADTYTITLQEVEGVFNGSQTVYLKDKLTNTSHDFSTGAYTFTSDAGRFDSRFEIVYQNPLAVNQPTFNDTSVVVYKQNNELIINSGNTTMSNVKVFDIRGRLLMEKNNINATQTKFYTGTTNEVLLVQITSDAMGTVTKKVIN